ncbi:MAG: ABC transporter substrate-binding protein [Myxococcales bacterium]|nr:ABC transporter substrate-binding protein [Myxococcales bacterium]
MPIRSDATRPARRQATISRRTAFVGLGSVALALALPGCSSTEGGPALPKLRVGTVPWAGWSPLDVAKAKGFFEAEGLDVEVVNFEAGGDTKLTDAIADGSVDCGFYMQGTLLTYAMQRKSPIVFLGEVDWSYGGDQIIVRPPVEAAIEAIRAKKKKVGTYSSAASNMLLLDYYFRDTSLHAGWSLDVTTTDVVERSATELVDTYLSGEDAVSLNADPDSKPQIEAGGEVVATSATYPGILAEGLMANRERYVTVGPDAYKKLFSGWIQAVRYMYGADHKRNTLDLAHRDEVLDLVSQGTFLGNVTTDEASGYLGNVRIHSLSKLETVNLDKREDVLLAEYGTKGLQPLRSHIREVAAFVKRTDPKADDFDLAKGIDTGPLEAAISELKAR